jgi:hypothetical protein
MHRILAVILALAAFLTVTLYWGWQLLTGQPALEVWVVGLRAVGAMLVTYVLGWFVGRLGVSVTSEAWQEAEARRRDQAMVKAIAAKQSGLLGGGGGEDSDS